MAETGRMAGNANCMNIDFALVLLLLLFIKHFICDYLLQTQFMLENKGIYGHEGGMLHAAIHGLGTMLAVMIFGLFSVGSVFFGLILGFLDSLIHYHIDYFKVKYSKGLTPNDKQFWVAFGLDQFCHHLTYIILVAGLL